MTSSAERARLWPLLRELAITDFRLKYNDSALGYLWSLLSPLAMLSIYYFVFRFVVGVRTRGYEAYLLIGILYWAFFQDCTFSGITALQVRAGVLKAMPLPPLLVIVARVLSTFVTIAINTALLCATLLLVGHISPFFPLLLLPLACLAALGTAVALLLGLAYAHFRDLGLVWGLALQAWFWLTPVVYALPPGRLADALYLNPVARCLFLLRWYLVYNYLPPAPFVVWTVLFCFGALALALAAFLRRQRALPELL